MGSPANDQSGRLTGSAGWSDPATLRSAELAGVTVVEGEVDLATAAEFSSIVEAATTTLRRDGRGEAHLDLGGVTFIGVAGVRVLVEVAAEVSPGAVVVRCPPTLLARILQLGWGTVTGLRVEP